MYSRWVTGPLLRMPWAAPPICASSTPAMNSGSASKPLACALLARAARPVWRASQARGSWLS
jgi:hypothetical protein